MESADAGLESVVSMGISRADSDWLVDEEMLVLVLFSFSELLRSASIGCNRMSL